MKEKTARNTRTELLMPGEFAWELWAENDSGEFTLQQTFSEAGGAFSAASTRRVLGIPAAWVWILPAWLKGSGDAQLRPMASLYLERAGIPVPDTGGSLDAATLAQKDGASLVRIVAPKEHGPSLADFTRLPDRCVLAPVLLSAASRSIIIWRELGRLALGITLSNHLVYYSQLSSAALDEHAVTEILNVCVQLGFQRVVGGVSSIVLWTEEGDVEMIRRSTGMEVQRVPKPAPRIPETCLDTVTPEDVKAAQAAQARRRKKRLLGLAAGAAGALAVAAVAMLTLWAAHARTAALDEIAMLAPKALRVEQHKREWDEVAVAVDPARSPMETLLHCMEPQSAPAVSLTHFEAAPGRILLRGRTATPAQALQYVQEMRSLPALAAFNLDAAPPAIASDNSATFELKGAANP